MPRVSLMPVVLLLTLAGLHLPAYGQVVPGTGTKVNAGDDFEDETFTFTLNLPKASTNIDKQQRGPAGFRATPCYSAELRGPRRVTAPQPDIEAGERRIEVFADGVVSIEEPTPDGFRLRVLPVLLIDREPAQTVDWAEVAVPWTVQWMGVEG